MSACLTDSDVAALLGYVRRAFSERLLPTYTGDFSPDEQKELRERILSGSVQCRKNCREWTGPRLEKGYGQLTHRGRKLYVHRLAYELWYGVVPLLHVLHECDNPPCCNPEHLYDGSNADNVRDRMERGRDADRRGELNGRHILTEADVRAIRSEYASGRRRGYGLVTYGSLAAKYGVAKVTIEQLLNGKSWKHVRKSRRAGRVT